MKNLNILFVTPYPISRIRIRSYGFVRNLARIHRVTVLALSTGEDDGDEMQRLREAGINIISIQEKRSAQYIRSFLALGKDLPLQVAFGASPALHQAIVNQIAQEKFDLLHVEFIRALGALPDNLPLPVLWDAVDCVSNLYAQGAQYGATTMLRLLGKPETRRVQRYEQTQLGRFRQILVTSERERQGLLALVPPERQVHAAQIHVLPHGIDSDYYQLYTGPRQPETIVFSGKMSFHANIAGVRHLVADILPLIWQQRPSVKLIIAGSNPPTTIQRLARDPRIVVTGYVADLRPYLSQSRVSVSPLPYAVGIQNKVLEAIAMGTPVVATSCAAAGLYPTAENPVCVADTPQSFAALVLRLLDEQTFWQEQSDKGSKYISTYHNWDAILERLSTIYTQMHSLSYQ